MPVSVCESNINSAIRDSITNSTNNYINTSGTKTINNNNDNDTAESIQNKLAASAKRVLLSKIEYEEVNNYGQSVLDTLKSKYIILKPLNNSSGKLINQQQCNNNNDKDTNQQNTTISATTTSGQQNGQQHHQRHTNELPQPKRCLFPRENVQIGWRSSNRKWQVGAGMMNVGNTCYLNSTLQAVFHVPAMANWLLSDSGHREKCEDENGTQGGCIICAMSKTLIASQSSQSSAIRPYLVYTKLRLICKHLTMGRQEDAHEFLRYLVEAMEKTYLTRTRNYKELDQFSKETTPLNQILGGYLKSAVRCLACGHVSTTFQHFQDLLLDIRKANTVEEALDGYFARERLEDMGYKCEACKKKVSATKQFSLERAPISLCVQLKRFSMMGTKLNKHIAIRPRLDLTKFSSTKKNGESLTYKLVAMVTHLGASQHCGHYTAIGLTDAGGYYQFDDSCVRPISLQNVLNTNAYIIFYELDEQQQQQQQQINNRQTSTQTSGEHEKYKENKTNGHGNNENSNHNQQQQRNNLFSTNNNYQNSKLISKLEINGENSTLSTAATAAAAGNSNNNNTNGNRLIGPQLPDEYNNVTTSNGCNNNKLSNPQSPNKFNNNNNKINGENSISKWMQSLKQQNTNSNKLVINFKNSTTNSNSTTMTSSATTTLNGQLNNNKFQDTNISTKLVNKIKTIKNENNNNNNNDYNNDDNNNKSTEIIKTNLNNNKPTLPSMPKLLGSPKNGDKSTIHLNNETTLTTINKNITINNNNNNLGQLQQNGLINSPIKSLVPYESDDDDDEDNNNYENKKIYKNTELQNGSNNNNTAKRDISNDRMNNNTNNNNNKLNNNKRKINKFGGDESNTSLSNPDSSPDIKRSKQTPPSPPVVKTKAGLWQVTPLETIKPIISNGNTNSGGTNSTTNTLNSDRKNPFATTPNSNSSTKLNGKEKRIDNNFNKKIPEDRGPTVTELLKYSHRGYGAPVLNWNGQKTDLEKEISEETRMERKRELEDDEENEMDRGKQKKVKIHGPHGNNNRTVDNPGFNPFQEQQLQNNQNRRWNNSSSGGSVGNNHHNNNNSRFQHQNNNGYRHNNNNNNNNNNHYNRNHNNHNNNFRRNNKYQTQRSHHHQRNGGWR